MLNFQEVPIKEFLTSFWQKKPLIIRQALPDFSLSLSAEELAGLAMEEEIESRIVKHTPNDAIQWHLQRGPFKESDFHALPDTHWTLLVQGVDRFIPEITALLDHFNFLPQWRVDDIMISYAVEQGTVGPHYDNYDVFLYQAKGRRKWSLTKANCVESNYLSDVELRIMDDFTVEEEFILEEGDMLYLPAHVGHYGVSLSQDCMTYSFGYRSYQQQELWDSLGEYVDAQGGCTELYADPDWSNLSNTAEIPDAAWISAKKTLQSLLNNDQLLKEWFGAFATRLDQHAESVLPVTPSFALSRDDPEFALFKEDLSDSVGVIRNAVTRFAYISHEEIPYLSLFVNGVKWTIDGVSFDLVKKIANNRLLSLEELSSFSEDADQFFLYELWQLGWIEFVDR